MNLFNATKLVFGCSSCLSIAAEHHYVLLLLWIQKHPELQKELLFKTQPQSEPLNIIYVNGFEK